jgi:hypothetical protein
MAITTKKVAGKNLDHYLKGCGGRIARLDLASGPRRLNVGDAAEPDVVDLSEGFCNGACHHWVTRAIRTGTAGLVNSSLSSRDRHLALKEPRREEKKQLLDQMAEVHARHFEQGRNSKEKSRKASASSANQIGVQTLNCEVFKPRTESRRSSDGSCPQQTIDAVAVFVKNELKKDPALRGAVLGFDFEKNGHAVAVVKNGISYGAGTIIEYQFFDPNLGVWQVEEWGIDKVLRFLFGPPIPLDDLLDFTVKVPPAPGLRAQIQSKWTAPTEQDSRGNIYFSLPKDRYDSVLTAQIFPVRGANRALRDLLPEERRMFTAVLENRSVLPYYYGEGDDRIPGQWDCSILANSVTSAAACVQPRFRRI